MAGRPKEGIEFSGWAADVFEDPKVERLIDGRGAAGFTIYFYLCQRAFGLHGYFLDWSYEDSAVTARRIGGGVGSRAVQNTVELCLLLGLFDNGLFVGHGILTSRGIQRSFVPALKKRRVRSVIADYWLLDERESEGLVLVPKNRV